MDAADDTPSFEQKWHDRWPEWALGMVFVPVAQRARTAAWFALLQELAHAALGGADPTPGLAKLAWWQEELTGWSKGARRHPLGAVLQPLAAPWLTLAHALPGLQAHRRRPGESAAAGAGARTFADAVLRCEGILFDAATGDPGAVDALRDALAREWAMLYPDAVVATDPPHAGNTRPPTGVLSRPRAIHDALVAGRRDGDGQRSGPVRALLAAWQGARRGARPH
ncbi:MAG TPA: hypothetical protein VLK29_12005 [Luteimonas sp.]|nr:hypothetical protein [Luteimonas sp.]